MWKKAVAPAIRKGSFVRNKVSDGRKLLVRSSNSFSFELMVGMGWIKVKPYRIK